MAGKGRPAAEIRAGTKWLSDCCTVAQPAVVMDWWCDTGSPHAGHRQHHSHKHGTTCFGLN